MLKKYLIKGTFLEGLANIVREKECKASLIPLKEMPRRLLDMSSEVPFIEGTLKDATSNAIIIGESAFYGCESLTSVSLPVATNIGSNAFYSCVGLTSISLPAATSISRDAFSSCEGLTDIYVPNAVGAYTGAPWGATNATVHYNTVFDEDGNPILT